MSLQQSGPVRTDITDRCTRLVRRPKRQTQKKTNRRERTQRTQKSGKNRGGRDQQKNTQKHSCVPAAEEEDEAAMSEGEVARKLQEPSYFGALQLLCDEAGFLVESKAHKMLSSLPKHGGPQGVTPQDQGLIQAASVVKALGVTDGASFEALMAALTVADSEGVGSQSLGEPRLIHPADAVTRLREFVEAENGGAGTASTMGLAG